MQFHKQAVVEWLDGTRLPESACTPEGLALLSSVMRVLDFLGADGLVVGIARELAEAVHARKVKMKDALAACNHEPAFMRALADLYDQPLPRFRLAHDTQPTHFVAALVKPGGIVERVEVAHRDALHSIARLLHPECLHADRMGFCNVLHMDTDCYVQRDGPNHDDPYNWRSVQGTVQVYFDKSRRNPDDALPASFIHPSVVPGSVVCALRWEHAVYCEEDYAFTSETEPWLRCDGFASLPEPWIRDELWRLLGKWIAGGHECLHEDDHGDIQDTLMDLVDMQTALRHATQVSYGSQPPPCWYCAIVKEVRQFP
jgi:hypothetical protein